jgi:Major royal jelly protein
MKKQIWMSLALIVSGMGEFRMTAQAQSDPLQVLALSEDRIWNGITVSKDGRIFVNFPAISPRPIQAVGEIGADKRSHPYPGGDWNSWAPGKPVEHAFVGTNAVRIGSDGALWVVDTGSPSFGKEVLPNATKIVKIDLTTNTVSRVYPLGNDVVKSKSYIDDIRFHGQLAYLTDAGVPGILVLDLSSGNVRRVLDHAPSTTGKNVIKVDGEVVIGPEGKPLIQHVDQMEVTPDGQWFYFQPLAGPMSRIATRWLDDTSVRPEELAKKVEPWFDTGSLGGTAIDANGDLYLEDLNTSSILKLTHDRKLSVVFHDARLHWLDAPWIHDGWLYLPQAQLDRAAQFHQQQSKVQWPLHLYRLRLDALPIPQSPHAQ